MPAELTRYYNRSLEQLHTAIQSALQAHLPGYRYTVDGSRVYTVLTNMRPPFTGFGEVIEVSIPGPGTVNIYSDYRVRQLANSGDNEINVERLARFIDAYCQSRPPCCPKCGVPWAAEDKPCYECGTDPFDPAAQPRVPNRGPHLRFWTVLISSVLLVAVIAGRIFLAVTDWP